MASTSGIGVEIRKFDGKNFVLWKEIMQDVLIIQHRIEAIWHNTKPASMTEEEWRSLDEIARLTIQMYLAENVYFSIAKETSAYALCEKLQDVYEKMLNSSKLILIRQLFNMKMKETKLATSHINTL